MSAASDEAGKRKIVEITKLEAVRRAVALGYEGNGAGVEYIKREFGIDLPLQFFATAKEMVKKGIARKLQAYYDQLNALEPDGRTKPWHDQRDVALLLAESVADVVEYCRLGWLESIWVDKPDGRTWYVFDLEMERWIKHGMREPVGYESAMNMVMEGYSARRVLWNHLAHICAWDTDPFEDGAGEYGEGVDDRFPQGLFVKFQYRKDYDGRDAEMWQPTAEDVAASDWVRHEHWMIFDPSHE